MEAQKSSGFGCLWGLAIAIVIAAVTLTLCWSIPVGKTDEGDQVIVGDYILGPLSDLITGMRGTEPVKQSAPAKEETPTKGQIIDAEVFDQLKPGVTTYSLIKRYMGPGELLSANKFGDLTTEAYRWHNPDGSVISLVFQNGVLVSKSQNGLR